MDALPAPEGIDADEWACTPLSIQQAFVALLSLVPYQQQQLAALQAQVLELSARLNQHSQNSSKPPSSDPPSAPPRPARVPRGRAKGAQPGHQRHQRPEPDPDLIDTHQHHRPLCCPGCLEPLPSNLPDAGELRSQYIWELPVVRPLISAHHYHTLCCPACGDLVSAQRPADLPPGCFGPQTAATVAMLHGRYRLSNREICALLHDLFGLSLSVGSVVELQQSVSAALAPTYEEIHSTIQQQSHVHIDETGWKEAGKRRWLWVVVSTVATLFHVAASRGGKVVRELLGEQYSGLVSSDRLKSYQVVPSERRQLCWAHLLRNLRALSERPGSLGAWAADVMSLSEIVFQLWHGFRGGTITREELQELIEPIQVLMQARLVAGTRRYDAAEGLSHELLNHWQALWTFVGVEGVEPTNNAAERALRPAVLWRKGCFGAQSVQGNSFVERILTVSATCRQQNRHLHTFLTEAVSAYWAGRPAPSLVPSP